MKLLPTKVIRLTPKDQFCFFGYYDVPAFDEAETHHLSLRVPFMDRMPEKDDMAEILSFDVKTGLETKLGNTTSWCFQQGCFLQWIPAYEDTVIWNVRRDNECGYGAVIKNIKTGVERFAERPVATVSPNGRYALSINFDRLFDFRPGYGYAGCNDRWKKDNHPKDDGIFLVDLLSGKYELIISLEDLWNMTGKYFKGEDQKILVNHINFNVDGSRFVFLLRNCHPTDWKTATITANIDGSDIYVLSDFAYASHYYWAKQNVLAIHSSGIELGNLGKQLYELIDKTHWGHAVDTGFFIADGHVSYSPEGEYVLYDSYPKEDGNQELYLYDLKTRRGGLLGRFKSAELPTWEIRSDLHPRWAPSGTQVSIDATFEGFRGIYLINVEEAKKVLRG